ncbi:MAG: cupin domain-containing protein [Acidobacteriaceae bacterium]
MRIVSREDLPSISSVQAGNAQHNLGIVKDFHASEALAAFVPDLARLSLSWVYLDPGQELALHAHPTKSMIIVAQGTGRVSGDLVGEIRAGDIVVVPPGARHGFVGDAPEGFWALSVQFEGAGLYENTDSPRVAFADSASMALIVAENEHYMQVFDRSALVEIARSCTEPDGTRLTERLLDSLQPWSDQFQRLIAQRAAAEDDPAMRLLAQAHLEEELGHNRLLEQSRLGRKNVDWDPLVAAAAAWFIDRMSVASSVERTVLAHLVLEGSGMVFHRAAMESFPGNAYFEEHGENDIRHLKMGYEALAGRTDWTVDEVLEVMRKGWDMMTLLADRVADLVRALLNDDGIRGGSRTTSAERYLCPRWEADVGSDGAGGLWGGRDHGLCVSAGAHR